MSVVISYLSGNDVVKDHHEETTGDGWHTSVPFYIVRTPDYEYQYAANTIVSIKKSVNRINVIKLETSNTHK